MANRKEEYVKPDGTRTTDRSFAVYADPEAIRGLWSGVSIIPPGFAIATAYHEGAINEIDTEPDGFVSIGLYQISENEKRDVGEPGANLLNLYDSTFVYAKLAQRNLKSILDFLKVEYPTTLDGMRSLPKDVWAYLAMAHNQGRGNATADGKGALGTLFRHGLNWEAYKIRNKHLNLPIITHGYGDDCVRAATTNWYPRRIGQSKPPNPERPLS